MEGNEISFNKELKLTIELERDGDTPKVYYEGKKIDYITNINFKWTASVEEDHRSKYYSIKHINPDAVDYGYSEETIASNIQGMNKLGGKSNE